MIAQNRVLAMPTEPQRRTLPCGCRLDGSYVCLDHERQSVPRFIAGEVVTLAALTLFFGMIGVWATIFSTS